jgi:hypothetical protein
MNSKEILLRLQEESINIEGQDGVKYVALTIDDAYMVALEIVKENELLHSVINRVCDNPHCKNGNVEVIYGEPLRCSICDESN